MPLGGANDANYGVKQKCFGLFCYNLGSHDDEFCIQLLLREDFLECLQVNTGNVKNQNHSSER